MVDFIVIGIVAVIVIAAMTYIVKAKKSGVKCIGCSSASSCSGTCGGNCGGDCNCGSHSHE